MSSKDDWTAEQIRKLRGEATRTEFALLLGVSPLTVYRWELPAGAQEARRPRGAIRRRLEALARGEAPVPERRAEPEAPVGPTAEEMGELSPLLDRILDGDFASVEDTLVALLASGRLPTAAGRALAAQGLARIQLLGRGEVRGAFTTLLPVLGEADGGRLPPGVACEVLITAALVWAGLDGRIFDAGKTNAYAARAERLLAASHAPGARFLLWYAQLSAAQLMNDPPLLACVLARGEEVGQDLERPLLRCMAEEVRAIAAHFNGQSAKAARHLAEVMRLATEGGFHLMLARVLLQGALQQIDDGCTPEEALAVLARAEEVARAGRVPAGWHSLYAGYVAGEAHLRAGRFAEAEAALQGCLQLSADLRWSPGTLPLFLARLYLLTGRQEEVQALAERFPGSRSAIYVEISRLIGEATAVLARITVGGDREAEVERFLEITRAIEAGAWSFLRRNVMLAGAAVAVFAGTDTQVRRALHGAQQALDAIPAVWAGATLDGLRGLHAQRRGQPGEARPLLERALATFALAGDQTHAALVRQALAAALIDLGAPEAESVRAASAEELARLRLPAIAAPALAAPRKPDLDPAPPRSGEDLAVRLAAALRRLCVRGMSPTLVQRELLAALAALFPGTMLRLEEVRPPEVPSRDAGDASAGPAGDDTEISDGSGRRLRVIIDGPLSAAQQALLGSVAGVASLALEVASLRGLSERTPAAAPLSGDDPEIPGFVSASPMMRRLKADLVRLSRSRATVIVTGESGSGKEVVARALHDLSVRAGGPYIAFNCAAVPRELFEGQLFGYRRGAFTGAVSDQPGVIRAADGGTLFLDEIGELPLDIQPKLLRFLENGEIFPLGERRPVQVDVRVVAATHRDLEQHVRERRFREDLFYRLQVVPLRVPPLRERHEDLVALARHFVRAFTPAGHEAPTLAADALAALLARPWPGNVRELRNAIERTLAFEPLPKVLCREHLRLD